MHDIAFIRTNPEAFDAALARRGAEPVAARILELDAERRSAESVHQTQLADRKRLAKEIGAARAAGNEVLFQQLCESAQRRDAIGDSAADIAARLKRELDDLLARLPNLPASDVPFGADETDNVEVRQWGKKREFNFTPKEHADLGPALGMEFETGAKLSGARFTFLRGDMARLHRALAQFMLDKQTRENGYTECNPPVLVNDNAMYGTDKLPKFAGDSFQTHRVPPPRKEIKSLDDLAQIDLSNVATDFAVNIGAFEENTDFSDPEDIPDIWSVSSHDLRPIISGHWLIPTSEVPLTASVAGEILPDLTEPIRMTAHTLCFRSEAGAAGRDTRGFIRQHQFEKVELVSVCRPEDSEAEHERMTKCAEGILEALNLPYRRVLLCTGDMGFGARKTYDLEVWLPGQGAWREISSCSNTGEFQARRMNARYRPAGEKKPAFVHTLNGSGLAVGRTLVAVMENYQQADGSVTVPEVLAPYMGGVTKLEPRG